jgi:transposase
MVVVTMHIDACTYKRGNKTYRRVLLRNSYRVNGKVCHDTIANLSHCSEEEIKALKLAFQYKNNLSKLNNIGRGMRIKQGLCFGATWVLMQIAKRLGIQKIIGKGRQSKLVLWLVISSVIAQGSRLSAVRLAKQHAACDILGIKESFNEDDLYKAMDWLEPQQKDFENRLFEFRHGANKPNFYLYDVTSSYLEGGQNELGDYGYNRDKKVSKKQIVIGLMTDDEGYPIAIEVFRGNTRDPKTVPNQIRKMADRFGVKEVTFIGDRGMVKSTQITELTEENFNYITAITKPQIETLIKNKILQIDLFDDKLAEISENGIRYILRRNPIRAREIKEIRESKLSKLKEAIQKKNSYLQKHPRASVVTAINKIMEKANQLRIEKWINIKTIERILKIEINTAKKEELSRLDGCYVIKTNLGSDKIGAKEIHSRYKDLAEVEWAFRTMKTTLLEVRPVYVRRADRTRAHVFIIMLAYMLIHNLRKLWRDVELTTEECITELASICSVEINIPGSATYQTIPEPRLLGKLLLQKADIILPNVVPCRNVVVDTRKKLVAERKSL